MWFYKYKFNDYIFFNIFKRRKKRRKEEGQGKEGGRGGRVNGLDKKFGFGFLLNVRCGLGICNVSFSEIG